VARERKSVQGIRTMGALVDNRRTRTSAGALLEMSAMANEKLLLSKELERSKVRQTEIHKRLNEIAAKERRLMTFVQTPGAILEAAPVAPAIDTSVANRMKVKELSY
jgi:hypothetical protein